MRILTRVLSLLVLATAPAAQADTIVDGDLANGAAIFHVQCAACHGPEGRGAGPLASKLSVGVGNLRDPAFLSTHSDDDLRTAILKGGPQKGKGVSAMPSAPWLTSLELADLLAYLRHGELRVKDFFPQGRFFIAKTYPLDKTAQAKLQKRLGRSLGAQESKVTVVSVFGDGHAGGPDPVPDDPVQLDKLDPKDGKGYLVFADLLAGKSRALYGIAVGRDGSVLKVASGAGLADGKSDKPYQGFVGLGAKGSSAPLKPKGKGKTAPTAAEEKAFNDAYSRALTGIELAEREEKDRHWADTK